jgi:hypothetical protein
MIDPLVSRYWPDLLGGAMCGVVCLSLIVVLNRRYPRLPGDKGQPEQNHDSANNRS